MDKDKVLQALNMCEGHDCHCDITHPKCPYLREDDKHANYGFPRCFDEMKKDILAILKEQEEKIQQLNRYVNGFSRDAMPVVRCKDCDNMECDGRAGTIVCGITGESHSRLWFCADGERKSTDEILMEEMDADPLD